MIIIQNKYDWLQKEVDVYRTALKMISKETGNSKEIADEALKIFEAPVMKR